MTAKLVYTCDGGGCRERLDADTVSFVEAKTALREEGWTTRNESGIWMHYCPDCRPRGHWERD